jgi:hypothetical protein
MRLSSIVNLLKFAATICGHFEVASLWATRDFSAGSVSGQTRSRCLTGWLSFGLPTQNWVWLTSGLQPVGHR